ncbi:hypothetical protein Rsub_10861 [Raphidocelis subcapitata]|uniref:Aldose 1-epimerase n=1 Tax=Raphidocelis subcapitata TaxID=307507 RepID=A0A2V0PE42_9CHLO|nr:hypothetical protein Rsub_10861 [Raphidocelis subcapitata]|eukprot:GBF98114.1 hypothetical protein Rsub_10861 [Raphidocelis subcapitata]
MEGPAKLLRLAAWLAFGAAFVAASGGTHLEGAPSGGPPPVPAAPAAARRPSPADADALPVLTLGPNARGVSASFTPVGCALMRLAVPDRAGRPTDVVLGYEKASAYAQPPVPANLGAIVGFVAGRVANASFALDGKRYSLPRNDGNNSLHSGNGWAGLCWDTAVARGGEGQTLTCSLEVADGDQGLPGARSVRVAFTLPDNAPELRLRITATTTKPTPANIIFHPYFNLNGAGSGTSVLNHILKLDAAEFTPTGAGNLPTGQIVPLSSAPAFDFSRGRPIGQEIFKASPAGYDHNFMLSPVKAGDSSGRPRPAAELTSPATGIRLRLSTTAPALGVYTAGHFPSPGGRGGVTYPRFGGVALEAQGVPDAVNEPRFPSQLLQPWGTFEQATVFAFDAVPAA